MNEISDKLEKMQRRGGGGGAFIADVKFRAPWNCAKNQPNLCPKALIFLSSIILPQFTYIDNMSLKGVVTKDELAPILHEKLKANYVC